VRFSSALLLRCQLRLLRKVGNQQIFARYPVANAMEVGAFRSVPKVQQERQLPDKEKT
jgi:hypothetical protein